MSTFQEIVSRYAGYSIDGPDAPVKDIEELDFLWSHDRAFDGPAEPVDAAKRLIVVVVEARLLQEIPSSRYEKTHLLGRLLTFGNDLAREGWQTKCVVMKPYSGSRKKDGKTLLAIREFFKSVRNAFANFEGAVLVGSFPHASVVRTWRSGPDEQGVYRVGLTPGQPRPFEIVLADLDGNWRELYHESLETEGCAFIPSPETTVVTDRQKVVMTNPAIVRTGASLRDVFWIRDAAYTISTSANGTQTVELQLACANPEIGAADRAMPNPVARPDICLSRIDARQVAVNPPSERLLKDGKPVEADRNPPIDLSAAAWRQDPALERTLLIEYFDRNHAFRSGAWETLNASIGMVESGLGTTAANEGLQGLALPREKESGNATLLDFVRWLKTPVLFRVIAAHADAHSTFFRSDDPDATVNAALVEAECGGRPWRWIEEGDSYLPSFKGHFTGDLHVYRTLWESRALHRVPPSLMLHVGCDVSLVGYGDVQHHEPGYGVFQNANSLLFYANQLAVLARVTWWNRGPFGFGAAFGKSDAASIGEGWRAVFEHVARDPVLGSQSTERKQAYIWNLVGDWTLRKHYRMQRPETFEEGKGTIAIDPLALLLRGDVYVKIHLPDPPHDDMLWEHVRENLRQMTPQQRRVTLVQIRTLKTRLGTVEKQLLGMKEMQDLEG